MASSSAPASISACIEFAFNPVCGKLPEEPGCRMKHISDTQWIVERAESIGFDRCGVARAEKFPELAQSSEWLARGYAGEMKYLADPRRSHPQGALPGVRSVVVCLLNYNTAHPLSTESPPQNDQEKPRGWISRYAWGRDYHEVLR